MQSIREIDSATFAKMWLTGASFLKANIDVVNGLNVFPVPDGDTGTNMYLTMQSAVSQLNSKFDSVGAVASKVARGSLMGARGNSGVILSQILRGMGERLADEVTLDSVILAEALDRGVQTAYKAVMKPVEGTILTVCKDAAKKAMEIAAETPDVVELVGEIIKAGHVSLQNTPNLLPVLKKAGVVDAGGKGLTVIFEGWSMALTGEEVDVPSVEVIHTTPAHEVDTDNEFGYCTEFIVMAQEQHVPSLKTELMKLGDCLLVVGGGDVIKVHVHTMHPGKALESAIRYGSLTNIKIENMQEQHTHLISETVDQEVANVSVVAVAVGNGMTEIFKSMGVSTVIEGGQTMNPSTEDIVTAVEKLGSPNVIILPNNSNIVMAAKQTEELTAKNVFVISSKSMPQGLSALVSFDPNADNIEKMVRGMSDNMEYVTTGQVTYATRDYSADNGDIHEGDIIGIVDGSIEVIGEDPMQVTLGLLTKMVDEDSEIISVFTGQDVSDEEAQELEDKLNNAYDYCEIEVHHGGQPLYSYIISVE